MQTVGEKLELGRRSLLDLSTRNRLLSIPKAISSKLINIYDEKSIEAYRTLVIEEKSMTFSPGTKASESVEVDDLGDDEAGVLLPQPDADSLDSAGRHSDTKLQTKLTSEKLQHRLLEMYYDARTFIEEQGVNILYLALGQLRWYDKNALDKERLAPLVLVPVTLTRKSAADRFHLAWLQEDAAENLSLAAKLKADFGLLLPEFKAGDEFDPAMYFSAVAAAVKSEATWEVRADAMTLGFFSFSKFLMYRDLDPENWPADKKIDARPLIVSVLQDGFEAKGQIFSSSEFVDSIVPIETQRHVVDSDSSQTLAIEAVRRGENLVLQGPPGTGKSQTITNIIAAAVADNKKVLFVSEKMAALEVVYRRLSAIGLSAACLELHSNRTNKRKVLEEFKATKDLGRPRVELRDEVIGQLDSVRDHLNSHAVMMHTQPPPHAQSPYRVVGNLSRLALHSLTGRPPLTPGAETWSPDGFLARFQGVQNIFLKTEKVRSPALHPWRGVGHSAILKLDADAWIAEANSLTQTLQKLSDASTALASKLGLEAPSTNDALKKQIAIAEKIAMAPALDRTAVANAVWEAGFSRLGSLVTAGRLYAQGRESLRKEFLESAWDEDVEALRKIVAEYGDSLFRMLSGKYRQGLRTIKGQLRGALPKTQRERLAMLDKLLESIALRKNLAQQNKFGLDAFGTSWGGEGSDWEHLSSVVDWMRGADGNVVDNHFRQLYAQLPAPTESVNAVGICKSLLLQATSQISRVIENYKLDCGEAFGQDRIDAVELKVIADRLQQWQNSQLAIFDWAQYVAARQKMLQVGLQALLEEFEAGRIARDELQPLFERSYYECVLRNLCGHFPSLINFDGDQHTRQIEKFKSLDKRRIEVARAETALTHYEGIPRLAAGIGPLAVLNGEIARKRGHMPLRRLFRQAAAAVQAIKPVFMMSPLSVAQFLEPGAIEFDLLVIDEASQIEPVDALGAIARCKQIVVVGDDRQLPPTRFFSRMTSEVEVDDEDDEVHVAGAADVESILSLCHAKGMPEMMLRWHYRSRHQSLIAVSNQEFYKNNLYIVPSPSTSAGELGLRFNHVKEGVFDTGGTRVNREEAKVIARAIINHAANTPHHSLGVASFSLQQKIAIQDELEMLRRQHPETEGFFTDHPTEPFFIKNLENVQGDERDVMFISVAYARNASGYLAMRFGPVGADGGERRLNVLISRAKLRCEVFSSITADDIDLERARGKGVAALKVFLRYAQTGQLSLASRTERGADSALETTIRLALEGKGLTVHPQVGIAGFFIDLAILDSESPGRYLLGIEVDGDSYHESRSARDRDRLRQAVLEDHGWILHRVWASDWFRQPDVELEKMVAALVSAKLELAARGEALATSKKTKSLQFNFLEREDETEMSVGLSSRDMEPYREAQFDVPKHKELHEVPPYRIAEFINRIIQEEGPVHFDEVVTRLRSLWGLQRAGNRIRDAIDEAVELLVRDKSITRKNAFVDLADRPVRVRDRSGVASAALRKAEYLPPTELQATIKRVLQASLGGRRGEIPQAVVKALGLSVLTSQVKEVIEKQIDHLHSLAEIELNGDVYRVR